MAQSLTQLSFTSISLSRGHDTEYEKGISRFSLGSKWRWKTRLFVTLFCKIASPFDPFAAGAACASASRPAPASGTSSGVMYVIVPPDTGPGEQMLVLTPAGQQCLVQIPEGAAPGTQFAVQLS